MVTLDGDPFVNAVTRFTARRGPPNSIRSDNSTNMVGANRELREVMQGWNLNKRIKIALVRDQIELEFNPPTA